MTISQPSSTVPRRLTALMARSPRARPRPGTCVASPSAGASTCTPTGRPSSPVPNGTEIAGWPGQVGRDRADVVQVHRQRVGGLGAEREGGGRRRRRQQHVEALVGGGEVADDQRAHLLRLAVVGVVVAGRQGVGAEHDAALHLGAEARRCGWRSFISPVVGGVDPQAVADAVVAGQVARRLGRGDQVVGRQAVDRRPAPTTSSTFAPAALERLGAPRARGPRRRASMPSRHQLGDDADPQALDAVVERGRRPTAPARGIDVESSGSWPAITSSSERGVGHGGGERADLVERRGEGDEAVAATPARRSASRRPRRTARRAGGSSRRCRSRAPSGANPAATAAALPPRRPAGHPGRVVRVAGRAERRVLGGRAHGELVEVGLADRRWRRPPRSRSTTVASYGGRQPSRILRRARGGHARGCRGCPSARPARRPAGPGRRPAATARVDRVGRGPGLVGGDQVEGVELASRASIAARCSSTHVDGATARRARDRRRASSTGTTTHGASPRIGGTRNRPSSAAGAGGQHLVAVERRVDHVGPQHVRQRERVRRSAARRRGRAPRRRRRGRGPRRAAR